MSQELQLLTSDEYMDAFMVPKMRKKEIEDIKERKKEQTKANKVASLLVKQKKDQGRKEKEILCEEKERLK